MKTFLLGLVTSLLLLSCQKEEIYCKTCGYDEPREYRFTVSGDLYSNCQGEKVFSEPLELQLYNQGEAYIVNSMTDEMGHFTITYSITLSPSAFHFSSPGSSLLLIVKEDSTIYYLPVFQDMDSLHLIMNDSLNLSIFLDINTIPLDSTGSINYWFGGKKIHALNKIYTKTGATLHHEIINEIKDKWRAITIDEHGNPALRAFWYIKKGSHYIESDSFTAIGSKNSCVMQQDSVVLFLD